MPRHEAYRVYSIRAPPQVVLGCGAVERVGGLAKLFGERALVVTGRGAVESKRVDRVLKPLEEAGVQVEVYGEVEPEPDMSLAERVAEHARRLAESRGLDVVVGFGGGSSLDMAKIASIAPLNRDPVRSYVGVDKVPRKGLPLILIPTTAGSGSEVSRVAVVISEEDEVKVGVVSDNVVADVAIVDPELTVTMNPKLTASTGVDALSHAIEAYMSLGANSYTDPLALEAVSLISWGLRRAYADGEDLEARAAMSEAALLAGLAFSNAGNCAGHAAAYAFAVKYRVPHGVSCGIALPYIMKFNSLAVPERLADIAVAMGVEVSGLSVREAAQLAVAEVYDLLLDLNLPTTLEDVGVPEEDIMSLASNMLKSRRMLDVNPRKVGVEEARRIFEAMWHGDVESKL